jgi:mRNA interferase RelE/StbE
MEYKAIYHHDIPHDLAFIPANMKVRIRKAIETRLLADPINYGLPLRKSLQGHRKLRVGDYRIIYRIQGKEIFILKIGHRKDVYPKLLVRLSKRVAGN